MGGVNPVLALTREVAATLDGYVAEMDAAARADEYAKFSKPILAWRPRFVHGFTEDLSVL